MASFATYRGAAVIILVGAVNCTLIHEVPEPTYRDGGADSAEAPTDGASEAELCDDNSDCSTEEPCRKAVCSEDHMCITEIDEGASCILEDSGENGRCEAKGDCVQCLGNSDCLVPGWLLCSPDNRCVQCLSDGACFGPTPRCMSYRCVECLDDGDCSDPTPLCSERNTCGDCRNNADCSGETPICSHRNLCVQCVSSHHCDDGLGCRDYECVDYEPGCGNGIVDVEEGEQCDDGNTNNGDACNSDCRIAECACPDDKDVCEHVTWNHCISNQQESAPRWGVIPKCAEDAQCPAYSICENTACAMPCDALVPAPDRCPPGLACRTIEVEEVMTGLIKEYTGCGF